MVQRVSRGWSKFGQQVSVHVVCAKRAHPPLWVGSAFRWRCSLTRNDRKRHGSITNGLHRRPSTLAGWVVGAGAAVSVDPNTPHTHPARDLTINKGVTATTTARFTAARNDLGCGEAWSRRRDGNPPVIRLGLGFTWRTSLTGIGSERQRWNTNGRDWRRLAVAGWAD